MAGDPDKEYGTNKPPPTRRVQERSKGDANTLKWFPKGGEGPLRELAEREWPLMVMIPWTPQPQRLHAFTRLKQQLEPVWGEHLFPFQIAS